jgi:hypothetical protein
MINNNKHLIKTIKINNKMLKQDGKMQEGVH